VEIHWRCLAALLLLSGCSLAVDDPRSWVSRQGVWLAKPEDYHDCLKEARYVENYSGVAANRYGAIGSSQNTPQTDKKLLEACMTARGYSPRGSGDAAYNPVAPNMWLIEAASFGVPQLRWLGANTAALCEEVREKVTKYAPGPCRPMVFVRRGEQGPTLPGSMTMWQIPPRAWLFTSSADCESFRSLRISTKGETLQACAAVVLVPPP